MLSGAKKICSVLCAIFVIFSLGLHTVQIKHEHHKIGNTGLMHLDIGFAHAGTTDGTSKTTESLADKMHMAEKKFVLFFLAATLLYVFLQPAQIRSYLRIAQYLCVCVQVRNKIRARILNVYLNFLYAAGILNPKLH